MPNPFASIVSGGAGGGGGGGGSGGIFPNYAPGLNLQSFSRSTGNWNRPDISEFMPFNFASAPVAPISRQYTGGPIEVSATDAGIIGLYQPLTEATFDLQALVGLEGQYGIGDGVGICVFNSVTGNGYLWFIYVNNVPPALYCMKFSGLIPGAPNPNFVSTVFNNQMLSMPAAMYLRFQLNAAELVFSSSYNGVSDAGFISQTPIALTETLDSAMFFLDPASAIKQVTGYLWEWSLVEGSVD